jgi:hypothetical protein
VDSAREQFDRLRALSFVAQTPRGLKLHDLLRDLLVADLRWRNPELFSRVLDRILRHTWTRYNAVPTPEQPAPHLDLLDLPFSTYRCQLVGISLAWASPA